MDEQEGTILFEFGRRVEQLCEEKSITITDLSHATEMDYSHMVKIIKGQKDVRLTTINRIAAALGVDPSVLVTHIE